MFIDIHGHFCRIPHFPRPDGSRMPTLSELLALHDKYGIDRAVLLPISNAEWCFEAQSVDEVLEAAAATGRFIPFCNPDPRAMTNSPDAPLGNLMRWYRDKGCKGIGEIRANMPFLDPLVQNLFKHAEEVGFSVTFHLAPMIGGCYGLYDDPGLPQLETCLRRFPNLKFFGHSQAFWAEMAPLENPADRCGYPNAPIQEEGRVPYLMRKYPNLYGDLSAGSGCNALKRDRKFGLSFMNEFQDRLFFGTDICTPDATVPLADYLLELRASGELSEAVFRKIAGENAVRVLNL